MLITACIYTYITQNCVRMCNSIARTLQTIWVAIRGVANLSLSITCLSGALEQIVHCSPNISLSKTHLIHFPMSMFEFTINWMLQGFLWKVAKEFSAFYRHQEFITKKNNILRHVTSCRFLFWLFNNAGGIVSMTGWLMNVGQLVNVIWQGKPNY